MPAPPAASASAAPAVAVASVVSSGLSRQALKERGARAFVERNMGEAIRCFSEAIALPEPDDDAAAAASASAAPPFRATCLANRSAAYAATFEWDRALADAESAIRLAPQWAKAYYRKGQALEGLMRLDEALAAYEAGVALDPADAALLRQVQLAREGAEELRVGTAGVNPDSDAFGSMVAWLLQGKARFPSLYLKYYGAESRGVHALHRVARDECVLEVPLSHLMTTEVAKASDIGVALHECGVQLMSTHTFLSCYLLQERDKGADSFWQPYLRILPRSFANVPLFFGDDELALLKGSFTLGKIADRHAELKDEYDNIANAMPSFGERWTLADFVWARTVVITRIFGLVIQGLKTDGLVPMADMLNHKRPRETTWTYSDDRGAFTITALQPMARGDQVFDSYGRKCNSRFFVNYGFALSENFEDDTAVVWFQIPSADPAFSTKLRLLTHSGPRFSSSPDAPKRFQIPASYEEETARECFGFLRFVHAAGGELLLLSSGAARFDVRKLEPLSLRNELECLRDLAIAAQTALQAFDTSLEEDERLLAQADSGLSSNQRNCVLMRRSEKRVLHFYTRLVDQVEALVSKPWKDAKRVIAKQHAAGKHIEDYYINNVIEPLLRTGR